MHTDYMPDHQADAGRYGRLSEPSTYAGLAALVAIAFPAFGDAAITVTEAIPCVIGAVAAVAAVFKREGR